MNDVSGDTYPRQKEWQCRLSMPERLRLLLQLFPLELPPNFSGQITILNISAPMIDTHSDNLTVSGNSIKNLLAIAEANRIKYVFIKPFARSVRLPLLNTDFTLSITKPIIKELI